MHRNGSQKIYSSRIIKCLYAYSEHEIGSLTPISVYIAVVNKCKNVLKVSKLFKFLSYQISLKENHY